MTTAKRVLLTLLPLVSLSVLTRQLSPQWGAAVWLAFVLVGIFRTKQAGRPLNPLAVTGLVSIVGLTVNGYLGISAWASGNGAPVCYALFAMTAFLSVLVGAPFTAAHAMTKVPEALWRHPRFLQINNRISQVWGLAFAVNAMANVMMGDTWAALVVSYSLLAAATLFSEVYPRTVRQQQQQQQQMQS